MTEMELQNWITNNLLIVLALSVWSLVWKGLALWRAARTEQTGWFVAFLLVNTLGLLEIVYLYLVNPRKK